MSWDTVSLRLKEILQAVDGVYNVHQYFRDVPNETKFEETFSVDVDGQTLITGWMITRKQVQSQRSTMDATATLDVTHRVEIQGIMGLNDEAKSELLFQRSVDGVLNKLKGKFLLESDATGVALAGVLTTSEMNIDEIGHGSFSNIFIHFCRMTLSVTERI